MWKYHKETPCVATIISNKQNSCFSVYLFYKIGEQKGRTGPAPGGALAPVRG
jgi:hypothetical protein